MGVRGKGYSEGLWVGGWGNGEKAERDLGWESWDKG